MIAAVLAAALVLVVVAAGEAFRRVLRAGERREQRLEAMLTRQQDNQVEVLDRLMFAAGKPWKDTADRPEEPAPDLFDFSVAPAVVEEPAPGADYGPDVYFDELEDQLRSDAGDTVYVPATIFDTREVESGL